MKRSVLYVLTGWFCLAVLAGASSAVDPQKSSPPKSPTAGAPKSAAQYTLRYRFQPGETIRWKTVHQARVETTVEGTAQTAEADTASVTSWRVKRVEPDGTATFEYVVESVDMRQKVSGRMEMRYNSRTDKKAPAVFEGIAKTIGVPLTLVTLDAKGKVLKLGALAGKPGADGESQVAIRLPDKPVATGESWSFPAEIEVSVRDDAVRKIRVLESYTLENVKDNEATIRVATQILTPMDDPALESQVVQRETTGTVRFDLKAGRILARAIEVDKRVVGFAGHPASVLSYRTQFTAELLASQSDGRSGGTGETPLPQSSTGKMPVPPKQTQSAKRPAPAKTQ